MNSIKKSSTKTDTLKKALLNALTSSLGNVAAACDACKCSRNTYYEYMKNDEQFADDVKLISERALDFAEGSLFKQIQEGNTTATIFFLKTKGRGRGYNENVAIDHTTGGVPIQPTIQIIQRGAIPPPITSEDDIPDDI